MLPLAGKSKTSTSSATGGGGGSGGGGGKKRVRAQKYPLLPTGTPPWPARRLSGRHAIGTHSLDQQSNLCDYPQCHLRPEPPGTSEKEKDTPKKLFGSAQTSRASSDTGSEMGSEKGRGVRCKYYCKTCKDPSGVRFLNFHVDCFNRWHGDEECLQCQ